MYNSLMDSSALPLNIGFFYGYGPSGHFAAAQGISQFLPEKIAVPHFINLSELYPHAGPFVAGTYLQLIQKTPSLWNYLYNMEILNKASGGMKSLLAPFYLNKIRKILLQKHISAIVSTHAFASVLCSPENTGLKKIKTFSVITDIHAHAFWPVSADGYFTPTSAAAANLLANGVPAEKIKVSGMPLRKEFYHTFNTAESKKILGLSPKKPVFLITGGSRGLGGILELALSLKKTENLSQLIVLCGENKTLVKNLEKIKSHNFSVKAVSYVKNPALYYAACDCVIGKPGGLTVFETAAAKKPFIIFSPLPGQEEKNTSYLLKNRCAFEAGTETELLASVKAFLKGEKQFTLAAENLHSLHKKNASLFIASEIIKEITE